MLGADETNYTSPTIMATHERISIDPKVMVGKPVVRGTRITVELIMYKLNGGWTADELLEAYPHLTYEDIHAVTLYTSDASPARAPTPDRTHLRLLRHHRSASLSPSTGKGTEG
jgi:uncharacterized protein (DUF433 family)